MNASNIQVLISITQNEQMEKYTLTKLPTLENIQYDRYKEADPTFKVFQWSDNVQILASDKYFPKVNFNNFLKYVG